MLSPCFATALAAATIALCPIPTRAELPAQELAADWRRAENMTILISTLEHWLDAKADLPRRDTAPHVRFVSAWQAAALRGETATFQRGHLRGLYDPDRSEVLLVRPWDPRDARDVAVLLHELAHHRQAPHYWYCPAAQELPAYRLQEEWLSEQGEALDVNWIAVVLDAGCTPHDIHPE